MISIIIPTFNEEKYIGKLLNSIARQNFNEEIEIIVADAGSTDRTKEIIDGYKSKFKEILIIKGGMPAVGRNNGAKASSGDPIFFVDADMIISDNDFLTKSVDYFRKHKLGIAPTYLKPVSRRFIDHILVFLYNLWLPISKYIRPSGSMCIVASREVFDKTNGYPEDVIMAEDHDFCYAASKVGKYGAIPFSILFSMRRYNKEGRFVVLWKYLLSVLHIIFLGPIKKEIFKYEFGSHEYEHEEHNDDYD